MTAVCVVLLLLATLAPTCSGRSRASWQWRYRVFMPAHWVRLAQCEEHLNWGFHAGDYEGAFAFYTGTWDQYRYPGYPRRAWMATPWQQFHTAQRVARRLSIAVPWGCWRGPEHAWVRGGLPERGVYS